MHAAGLHLLDSFACLSDTYWLSADEQPLVSAYQLVYLLWCFLPYTLSLVCTGYCTVFFIVRMGLNFHGIVMHCITK